MTQLECQNRPKEALVVLWLAVVAGTTWPGVRARGWEDSVQFRLFLFLPRCSAGSQVAFGAVILC